MTSPVAWRVAPCTELAWPGDSALGPDAQWNAGCWLLVYSGAGSVNLSHRQGPAGPIQEGMASFHTFTVSDVALVVQSTMRRAFTLPELANAVHQELFIFPLQRKDSRVRKGLFLMDTLSSLVNYIWEKNQNYKTRMPNTKF